MPPTVRMPVVARMARSHMPRELPYNAMAIHPPTAYRVA